MSNVDTIIKNTIDEIYRVYRELGNYLVHGINNTIKYSYKLDNIQFYYYNHDFIYPTFLGFQQITDNKSYYRFSYMFHTKEWILYILTNNMCYVIHRSNNFNDIVNTFYTHYVTNYEFNDDIFDDYQDDYYKSPKSKKIRRIINKIYSPIHRDSFVSKNKPTKSVQRLRSINRIRNIKNKFE